MSRGPLDFLRRGKAWKDYVEQVLLLLSTKHRKLRRDLARAALRHRALRSANTQLRDELLRLEQEMLPLRQQFAAVNTLQARHFHREGILPLMEEIGGIAAFGDTYNVLAARRGEQLLILFVSPDDKQQDELAGEPPGGLLQPILDGSVREVALIMPAPTSGHTTHRSDSLLSAIRRMPLEAAAWLTERYPQPQKAPRKSADYFSTLAALVTDIDRIDFHAIGTANARSIALPSASPFDKPETLSRLRFAEPRRHSALFLHNNYYHFNCLSAGLRKRGWDVVTVSLESPESAQRQFYHGEDINLFDADPAAMSNKAREFFRTVPERYGALHFYGQGLATFFIQSAENSEAPRVVPWDFLELRRHRLAIGYMPSGCLDGGLQSSIRNLTGGLCRRCVWELRPDVCSDARSLAWNRKLSLLCDWVGLEGDLATPERINDRTTYGPVVTALDPERWRPDLAIPEDMRIERAPGEVLIYHAVGNYAARRSGGRDIKGTGAVMAAVETLQAEGLPVRLIFAHDLPSTRVRFLQSQADIVVDQLNYGRYGANAREAMMLGKATICRLRPDQAPPLPPLRPIIEVPMVDADEDSITDKLRTLVLDPDKRALLGAQARAFALAWHGQDACAERYERVIDRVRAGLPADSPDLYPA
ncbi:glycosyltransferase [Bosea sp. AS-1]|uniref:glycosyltransferase n=1 Tax=Bosea sp. AS-1 TaxID=2015316 RepID=UPI000B786107|nr:glycosyltransferase [Bosea sp. AS-1]